MEGLEEDEMHKDDLKIPVDLDDEEEDYGLEDEKGFNDYGAEGGDLGLDQYGDEEDNEPKDEDEEELD